MSDGRNANVQMPADAALAAPAIEPALTTAREPWRKDLRLLLAIAAPNVASTAAETMLSFVDYAIASQLGPAAQAAVQSGTMVFFTVFAFLLGMMACVSTMVGQSFGANRLRDCSLYAWQAIGVSLLFGLLGVVLWPGMPTVIGWAGHAPDVQIMEVEYTRMRLLSLGMAGACCALGHFFTAVHLPRISMYSVLGCNVVNAVLSYGLALGKWGLPAMGVEGVAVGTVVASAFRVVWLVAAMCRGRQTAPFQAGRTIRFDADKMRRLVSVGWPAGIAFLVDISAWSFFLVFIVGSFGTTHLAAMSTCWRFTELSFMPAVGIGIAVSAIVGRAIGEGRPDLARRRARLGAAINVSYMGLMGLVFLIFGRELMDLFSDEIEVIDVGARLMVFAAVFQMFDALAITYSNALRGAGDTRWPAVAGAVLSWGVMVGGGSFVARTMPQLGALGPWAMAVVFLFAISTTLWMRWRQGKWEEMDVIGRTEVPLVDYEPSPTETVIAEPAVAAEAVADDG